MSQPTSLTTLSPLRLVRVGLMTLASDRTVQTADETALALLGLSGPSNEVVGRALEELVQPVSGEDVQALCAAPPLTYLGEVLKISTRLLVHLTHLPNVGGLVATVTSVNEYLSESQALARVQLRNTVESIIAGFAHEVRNPLAAILSLTEAALEQDPALDTTLVRIPGLVGRVESLLRQALAYSRPRPPERGLHRPAFLLEHATSLLRPRDTAVQLSFREAQGLPPIWVDLGQGEQILVNLLENALDVARQEVQVRLSLGKTPVPSVCIEVADDGPGVPAELASRIFEPFFTTKAQGTGLGLAIARDLARLNGGNLLYVASPRGGANFRLYLPSSHAPVLDNSAR